MKNELKISQEFYHSLERFILSKVSNKDDAQDILHDALAKALLQINRLKDNTKLISWLYTIVRSSIIDYYRKRKRLEEFDEYKAYKEFPFEENDNKTMAGCLKGMMGSLPEKDRSIIESIEFNKTSQVALSKHLGLSISGTKSRIQRARKKLKEKIFKCCQIKTDTHGNIIHFKQKNSGPCCTHCT